MIVESMTHEEVYQELARDREAVSTWWRHQQDRLRRPCLKSRSFPQTFWTEYTSPRRNRYLIGVRVFDRRMSMCLTCVEYIRTDSRGMTTCSNWFSWQEQDPTRPVVTLPHAWKRYAERTGTGKTGIELLKHYLMHNNHGVQSSDQKAVGRSVRYMDVEHMSACVNEGVMLGQLEGDIFVAHTFITYDMSCGRQRQVFESKRSYILNDSEVCECYGADPEPELLKKYYSS